MQTIESKNASASYVVMTEMVMPNDTNPLNNLMGGKLMEMIDVAGAISAQRHSGSIVVTASVDHIRFQKSIPLGSVITIEAKVTRAFNSSMEVFVEVTCENIPAKTKFRTNDAFLTFVAVNEKGLPTRVGEVIPESEIEQKMYETALHRREFRLVQAGKLAAKDASHLKSMF